MFLIDLETDLKKKPSFYKEKRNFNLLFVSVLAVSGCVPHLILVMVL